MSAGIVNAVEVVNSFTGDDALMDFRRWVLAPDAEAIEAAAKKGKGRGKKAAAAAGACVAGHRMLASVIRRRSAWVLLPNVGAIKGQNERTKVVVNWLQSSRTASCAQDSSFCGCSPCLYVSSSQLVPAALLSVSCYPAFSTTKVKPQGWSGLSTSMQKSSPGGRRRGVAQSVLLCVGRC